MPTTSVNRNRMRCVDAINNLSLKFIEVMISFATQEHASNLNLTCKCVITGSYQYVSNFK